MKKRECQKHFSQNYQKIIHSNQYLRNKLKQQKLSQQQKKQSLIQVSLFHINQQYKNKWFLNKPFKLQVSKLNFQQKVNRIKKIFQQKFVYCLKNHICLIRSTDSQYFQNMDWTNIDSLLKNKNSQVFQFQLLVSSFIIDQQLIYKKQKGVYLPGLDLSCIQRNQNTKQFRLNQQYLIFWCLGFIQESTLFQKNDKSKQQIKEKSQKIKLQNDKGQLIAVYNVVLLIYRFFKKKKFDIRKFIKKKGQFVGFSKLKDLQKIIENFSQEQTQEIFLLECYQNHLILWQILMQIFPLEKAKFKILKTLIENQLQKTPKKSLSLKWLKQQFIQQIKNCFEILSNKSNSLLTYLKKQQEVKKEKFKLRQLSIQIKQSEILKSVSNVPELQWYKIRLLLCLACCLQFFSQKISNQDKLVYQAMIQVNSKLASNLTSQAISSIKKYTELIQKIKSQIKIKQVISPQQEENIFLKLIQFVKNEVLNVKNFKQCANNLKEIDKKQIKLKQQHYKMSTLLFLKFILRSLFITMLLLKFVIQWIIRKMPESQNRYQLVQLVKKIPIFNITHQQIKQIEMKGTLKDVLSLIDLFIQVQNQDQENGIQYVKLKTILKSLHAEQNEKEQKTRPFKKVLYQVVKNQNKNMVNVQYMKGLAEIIQSIKENIYARIGPYKIQNYLLFTNELKVQKMAQQNKKSKDKDNEIFLIQRNSLTQLLHQIEDINERQQREYLELKLFQQTIFR